MDRRVWKLGRAVAATMTLGFLVSAARAETTFRLNPASATYDHHPSLSDAGNGATWAAWHTYRGGTDGIAARRIARDGTLGALQTLAAEGVTFGPPTMVAGPAISGTAEVAWVVWSAKRLGRWQIELARWTNGRWSEPQKLSNGSHDAIFPTALQVGDDRVFVVWSENVAGNFTIRGCLFERGMREPLPEFAANDISDKSGNAYRPTLTEHSGEIWAFWDQYREPNYSVRGRRLLPTKGQIERLSPVDDYCLTPTALSHATGIHVAWLQKVDVVGGPGVISQWHTLQAAVRTNNEWKMLTDANGSTTAAELTQGLMAKISPRPVATGGYLGARTRPMLQTAGGDVWLLWERKSDHRGSTPKVPGDLIGRPIRQGVWQTPVVLHQGHVDYHVLHGEDDQPRFRLVASQLPRRATRTYERFDVALADAQPFAQDPWPGWHAIKLPIPAERTPRRQVSLAGKTYQLYWGDLHCHNNLSADAAGEADELNHYARDRAGLDVVVFTNNDFYNVPLTQYEYELGNLFAVSQTVEGKFLSLPGYEWTSRIPGVASAALDDPGNWLPPYRNRSYANHRSVIYPPAGGPLVHFTEVGNDIARLNEAVAGAGGITLSQHPTFKLSGHAVEVGLELTSGWSNYIARNPKLFHRSLDQGRKSPEKRLGFVANGDSHRRAPGLSGALTGIYATELTPAAIIEALRQRRCFATSGSHVFVDARAGDSFMGGAAVADKGNMTFHLHTIGTRAIISASLIRNGQEVFQTPGNGTRELHATFTDVDLAPGTHWYYWRINQDRSSPVLPGNLMAAHGHLAWSSPHWILVK